MSSRMRILSRIVLYCIIGTYVVPFSTPLLQRMYINDVLTEGYIYEIKTKYYKEEDIKSILSDFSKMGNNKIVRFKKNIIDRKITITDSENLDLLFLDKTDETIGIAFPTLEKCAIILKKGLDYGTLRRTLIHEYLHCMNYNHVEDNPNDLMAPSDSFFVDENNIRGYAKDLEKRF